MRPTVRLGEIISFQNGFAFKSENYKNSGAFVMRIKNVQDGYITLEDPQYIGLEDIDLYKDFLLDAGDILMSLTGNIGRVGIIKPEHLPALLNQRVARLKITEGIDNDFVFYFLSRKSFQEGLMSIASGAAQKNISVKDIQNFEIPLPPLETQRVIVAKLDQIFSELDQTKSEIQKNLDNTDELWKSALNQAFQGDWEMKKLGEVCDKITDGSHNPPKGVEHSDYIMISSRNIDEGKIIFDDVRYLEKQDFDLEDKRTNVKEGDVLLSIVGTIGKVCVVKNEYGKFTMQRSVAVVKPLENKLYSYYLSYFLQAPLFQNVINENARGVAQKGIYLNSVKSLQIPVPPLSEQEKIVEHLDQVSMEVKTLKSQYQSQLDNLEELKKSVLDKAFKGELGE